MPKVTQMTLSLPSDLVNATERLIKSGLVKTIDDFVTFALHHELLKMRHWSVNEGWVLKRPFHADKKDENTSITL